MARGALPGVARANCGTSPASARSCANVTASGGRHSSVKNWVRNASRCGGLPRSRSPRQCLQQTSSDSGHQTRKSFEEHAAIEARARLDRVVTAAQAAGVAAVLIQITTTPYKEIIEAANRHGCDVIFMVSHGRRGLEGLLVGSETQKVLTHCAIPVLVYR